jgi:hypothetical protein
MSAWSAVAAWTASRIPKLGSSTVRASARANTSFVERVQETLRTDLARLCDRRRAVDASTDEHVCELLHDLDARLELDHALGSDSKER